MTIKGVDAVNSGNLIFENTPDSGLPRQWSIQPMGITIPDNTESAGYGALVIKSSSQNDPGTMLQQLLLTGRPSAPTTGRVAGGFLQVAGVSGTSAQIYHSFVYIACVSCAYLHIPSCLTVQVTVAAFSDGAVANNQGTNGLYIRTAWSTPAYLNWPTPSDYHIKVAINPASRMSQFQVLRYAPNYNGPAEINTAYWFRRMAQESPTDGVVVLSVSQNDTLFIKDVRITNQICLKWM